MSEKIQFGKLGEATKKLEELDVDAMLSEPDAVPTPGRKQNLPTAQRAQLKNAIAAATTNSEAPGGGSQDDMGLSPEDHREAQEAIASVVSEEARLAAKKLSQELQGTSFLDDVRATILASVPTDPDGASATDPEILQKNIASFEEEYAEALESGRVADIVDKNPFAKAATTRVMKDMQANIERRLGEIRLLKPTPKIGRHADLRNVPITSLLEYVRFVPEIGIGFVAGNSAKNMIAELSTNMEATAQMSYNNRLLLASVIGVVMSWSAYQLRHSLYKDAQERGHTYARLPMPRLTATASAYKNRLRQHPVQTTFRTSMALGVALAGGNVLMNLAGVSGESVKFGKETIAVIEPVNEQMRRSTSAIDSFFGQIDDRCHAIVAAEVDPGKAGKGTGKGAKASYGPLAAAKDYLCFGKTDGGRQAPAGLVAFRESIGMAPGVSISQFYKQLWEARATKRAELFQAFTEKMAALQQLVQSEADVSFGTRVEQATLKHIPENKIPAAKAEVVAAINAYVGEINEYSAQVDGISNRIATEGLAAASAAGQDIEILAPRVSVDASPIARLPDSPAGKSGFFLTPELAKGAKETLSRVPGINFITPLLSNNQNLLAYQLMLLALLTYLSAENVPNAFFVHRERMRSRRLAREMEPKRRDYYEMLDKLAEQIADIVTEGIAPYKQLFSGEQGIQSREQLISAIKFAIVSDDPSETPDGTEHSLSDWGGEKVTEMSSYIKHLYDWGPEDAAGLDRAIGKVSTIMRTFKKGSPKQVAQELARLKIPGADIFATVFDPGISANPERFAKIVAESQMNALRHSVRYLVLKMQARQFVLKQLDARLSSKKGGPSEPTHADMLRDFLSSGVILSLDATGGKIAASADEVKYYRVWAELAAEQEQDQEDLLRVALAGRTFWDRRFRVDHGLGTVQIPEEFEAEFIASATTEPLGDAALLVESYRQMFDRMLERQENPGGLTDTLNYLNAHAVPSLKRSLEDEPRLGDKYAVDFSCAFSTRHGGPVIRCDLSDPTTGVFTTSIEAPFIVSDGSLDDQSFDSQIQRWFGEGGPGRLEAIARAKHQEMLTFARSLVESNREAPGFGSEILLSGGSAVSKDIIHAAQREILYRALHGRQHLRIESMKRENPLSEDEMPLFELPNELFTGDPDARTISRLSKLRIDGLFQLEALADALQDLGTNVTVSLDISKRQLVVARAPVRAARSITNPLGTKFKNGKVDVFSLDDLNNLDAFIRKVKESPAQSL